MKHAITVHFEIESRSKESIVTTERLIIKALHAGMDKESFDHRTIKKVKIDIEPLKTWKVRARMSSYATLDIAAESQEEALEIARNTDGGDFYPEEDSEGDWGIISATENL